NGSAREDQLIHQDNSFSLDFEWDFAFVELGYGPVIPIGLGVELCAWHGHALDLGHQEGEALGYRPASSKDSDYHEVVGAPIAFEDLVRHTPQRPSHIRGVEERCAHGQSIMASGSRRAGKSSKQS